MPGRERSPRPRRAVVAETVALAELVDLRIST
eukprot:CAMPEP_0175427650 /NCGR_PEP_ID=MMETSP0095-20121207/50448_1 /TAXON_ID=311494 /ORGANISM="Alexandrium monilatum, Strain CCMP3105" /LENGTH=31 /DNA_ID= /DNA_START= /DNA_END= /DNA_ORIENTATION=